MSNGNIIKERVALYVPAYYSYLTRSKDILDFLKKYFLHTSFILILFIEINHIIELKIDYLNQFVQSIGIYFLFYFLFFTIYESGYIYNDIITSKKEKNSTIRINTNFTIFEIYIAIISRILILLIIIFILKDTFNISFLLSFLSLNLFLIIIFYIHNNLSNELRIFSFFYLRAIRLLYPVFYFIIRDEKILIPIFLLIVGFSFYSSINYNINRYKKIEIKTIKKETILFSKHIRYILPINCVTLLLFGTILFYEYTKTFLIMLIIIIFIISLLYLNDLFVKGKNRGKWLDEKRNNRKNKK